MLLKIRQLRIEKKLSQQDVADKIGVSVRTYADYEKKNEEITLSNLQKIADALEVALWDLFPLEIAIEVQKGLPVTSEPGDNYIIENKNVLDLQADFIIQLKKENEDLRNDKIFFRNLIESKYFKNQ